MKAEILVKEKPPKPAYALQVPLPEIPAIQELAGHKQWLTWDYRWDEKKWTKPPLHPSGDFRCDPTARKTLVSFDEAVRIAQVRRRAGIGFSLQTEDGLTGIDLDGCRNPITGEIDLWAADIVSLGETYWEVTPSGRGIRAFVRGKIPDAIKRDKLGVEMYAERRYLTITGERVPGSVDFIGAAPRTIAALRQRIADLEPAPEPEKVIPLVRNHQSAVDPNDRIAEVQSALSVISADGYHEWIKVGMALENGLGPTGKAIWADWSATSEKYNKGLIEEKWRSFRGSGVTMASIFQMANATGWRWITRREIDPNEIAENNRRAAHFIEKYTQQPAKEETKHRNALRLVPFHEIKLNTQPRYLVKGVLPSRGLGLVWGPPKQGKSFWTCDIATHVAMGWEYRGRRAKKGIVVYCVLEGQSGFEARKAAMEQTLLKDVDPRQVPFFIMPVKMSLVAQRGELIKLIQDELGDDMPALVVIDTLNRSFEGSESDDESMTRYIKAADELTDTFDCLTLVVHHSGWDTSRARGHSALIGAIDVEISVKKSEEGNVVAKVECMKDGQDGAEFTSELEAVIVGQDDDGDDIVSCVITQVAATQEAPKDPNKDPRPRVTAASSVIALEALREALEKHGVIIEHQPEIPPDLPCVDVEIWRSIAYSRGISKGESSSAARNAFNGARQALQKSKHVGYFEGRVWLEPNPNDLALLAARIAHIKGATDSDR